MQNNLEGGDYAMANKTDNPNVNLETKHSNSNKKNNSASSSFKSVEPLPESSRPRRDGPGGEDGQ